MKEILDKSRIAQTIAKQASKQASKQRRRSSSLRSSIGNNRQKNMFEELSTTKQSSFY